ncbi:MAG: proline dehydrogenase family protein [Gemmatimonadaceae bacterium]|nr:proline dehydrogenase family protein [Gemmatimonadaceae bacterium]
MKRAVKAFMPGERPEDALEAGAILAREGLGTLYTKLGEALNSLDDAQAVHDHYILFFGELHKRGIPGEVSIKPTQLGLDLSMPSCADHLASLAKRADETGSVLWIDMEDSSYVDRTLELYRAVKAKHPTAGLALQAYLHRTPGDLAALMPLAPVIRLVKGAYAEPAYIAHAAKRDTDLAYYDLARTMLDAAKTKQCTAIFGTHDIPLVQRIIARAQESGVADGAYQVHMLYGIKMGEQRRLRAAGRTVKTLISYGNAWYRWYMRRLAERPANVGFVLRSMFG